MKYKIYETTDDVHGKTFVVLFAKWENRPNSHELNMLAESCGCLYCGAYMYAFESIEFAESFVVSTKLKFSC